MRRRKRKAAVHPVWIGLGILAGFAALTWLLEPKTRVTVVPADEPLNVNLRGLVT